MPKVTQREKDVLMKILQEHVYPIDVDSYVMKRPIYRDLIELLKMVKGDTSE